MLCNEVFFWATPSEVAVLIIYIVLQNLAGRRKANDMFVSLIINKQNRISGFEILHQVVQSILYFVFSDITLQLSMSFQVFGRTVVPRFDCTVLVNEDTLVVALERFRSSRRVGRLPEIAS